MSPRPFRILGLQQIAIGGPNKSHLRRLWCEILGLSITGRYRSDRENVDEDIATLGTGAFKCEIDLMQPLDPAKKPAVHEPPLNHIGLWVDQLKVAVEWLTAQGVRFAPGAAFAKAPPATMSASFTPGAMPSFRSGAKGC
jgi:lactoylglutathione lyase